jgi:hypothetical protein
VEGVPAATVGHSPPATWKKTLSDGGRGFLGVTQEGGGATTWQFDATGDPVGTAASGC